MGKKIGEYGVGYKSLSYHNVWGEAFEGMRGQN